MKIKDEQGNEVEVFTQTDLEARLEAERTKIVADAEKKVEEKYGSDMEKLKNDLADVTKKLEDAEEAGGHSNDGQVERLRRERDDATKALKDFETKVSKEINDFKSAVVADQKNDLLDTLSGTDAELRKKIEFEFDNYRPGAVSKKDIEERMKKAYQLATGNAPQPHAFDSLGVNNRGQGRDHTPEGTAKDNPNREAMRKALGISEEDYKKYGYKK